MSDLISRITNTVLTVQKVEIMGDLFEQLCKMAGKKVTKLIQFKNHRFLGLSKVLERLLLLWDQVEQFFDERMNKYRRDVENKVKISYTIPKPFLLKNDRVDIIHLYSLLSPLALLNKKAQAEKANQVEVLLLLYRARTELLGHGHFKHYKHTRNQPILIHPQECSEFVLETRRFLRAALDARFFYRYRDLGLLKKMSLALEMQLLLHPSFKNLSLLKEVIRIVNAKKPRSLIQHLESNIVRAVEDSVKSVMISLIKEPEPESDILEIQEMPTMFSADIMEFLDYDQIDTVDPAQTRAIRLQVTQKEPKRVIEDCTTNGRHL